MVRIHFATFFLILFTISALYPALIFHCFVESGSEKESRSLPAEFLDNGMACYFGLNNNEEETQTENPTPLFEVSIVQPQFLLYESTTNHGFGRLLDHKSTHQEVATPPPEVV